MIAIAAIALVMFAVGMNIHLKMRRTGFKLVPERDWRRWITEPAKDAQEVARRGRIGKLIGYALHGESLEETGRNFEHVIKSETVPFVRDLKVMKVCVSAAPLVGLLGTVTGMLATFGALSSGAGGDKTMGMVAKGISEALITTETGLVIALPGLFLQYQLGRGFERYKAFLAHLETVCTQVIHRRAVREELAADGGVRRAAAAQIAHALLGRLRERRAPSSSLGRAPAPGPSPALQAAS
jgi:biopolymer transport protein ExbB